MEYSELLRLIESPGELFPDKLLEQIDDCVRSCRACVHGVAASPVVKREGPASARLMVVCGSPSDRRHGLETVGPLGEAAAEIIAYCLQKTGLGRPDLYVTSALKHLPSKTPDAPDYETCRRWLLAEMAVVKPEAVLCLGQEAARAVVGQQVSLPEDRGRVFHPGFVPSVYVTVDPATIAAEPTEDQRRRARDQFLLEFYEVVEALGVFDPERGREELAQL